MNDVIPIAQSILILAFVKIFVSVFSRVRNWVLFRLSHCVLLYQPQGNFTVKSHQNFEGEPGCKYKNINEMWYAVDMCHICAKGLELN